MSSHRSEWAVFAMCASVILAGVVLVALDHGPEGSPLLTLGGGAVTGYLFGRRRNGSSIPPRGPA